MSKSLNYRDYWYERSYVYKNSVFERLKAELGLSDTELRSLIFDGKVVPVVVLNPSNDGVDVSERTVDIDWIVDNEDNFVTVGSYAGLGFVKWVAVSTTDATGGSIRLRLTVDGDVVINDVELLTRPQISIVTGKHFVTGKQFPVTIS